MRQQIQAAKEQLFQATPATSSFKQPTFEYEQNEELRQSDPIDSDDQPAHNRATSPAALQ